MNLLALDTSSNACSVALQVGDDISVMHVVRPREHTSLLVPMIDDCMKKAGIDFTDLDGIVLGNGPGSFIGMRIAASVAQGIAFGASLGIVPISSLAAVAAEVFALQDCQRVLVAQDAHMNEVYLAEFERGADSHPIAKGEISLQKVSEQLPDISNCGNGHRLTAGAGWQRYPEMLERDENARAGQVDILHPNARYLLGLGLKGWLAGDAIAPDNVVPEYVRMTVATKPTAAQL